MAESSKFLEKMMMKLEKCARHYPHCSRVVAFRALLYAFKHLISVHHHRKSSFKDDKQHVAITVFGGVGDFCFAAKYVQALFEYLPKDRTVIDVLCEASNIELVRQVFYKKKFVNGVKVFSNKVRYDLNIKMVRFPVILGRCEHRLEEKTLNYVQHIQQFYWDNGAVIQNDYLGRCYSMLHGRNRENQADIDNLLNMDKTDFRLEVDDKTPELAQKFGFDKDNFVTVQTGCGKAFETFSDDVRQWPVEYYNELVRLIKEKYPHIKIVQLGGAGQTAIPAVDIDLRGRTTLAECIGLLKASLLHISQEGGMPILRHFVRGGVGGKSIVLFGPTDDKFFGFDENINLNNRPCAGCCEWVTSDWVSKCAYTGNCAACMRAITPETVMKHISL